MLQTVHRWFDSLHLPDHPLEDLVHRDAHLIDNTNQACYAGYKAMKHRMQVSMQHAYFVNVWHNALLAAAAVADPSSCCC
jgi:hypothetical protein